MKKNPEAEIWLAFGFGVLMGVILWALFLTAGGYTIG